MYNKTIIILVTGSISFSFSLSLFSPLGPISRRGEVRRQKEKDLGERATAA